MKVLSLFDGMSVAQQAIKELGFSLEYFASEIDEYAKAVTQSNHPQTTQLGSVVGLAIDWQPDLLIGGSPCQDLSIAKSGRKGLDGERSGLFYEYVRIRDESKPKYFILENVASMSQDSKDKISEVLGVRPVMINASLVSSQNRKRLFWIGKLNNNGTYDEVEIKQPKDQYIYLKDILEDNIDIKYFCSQKVIDGVNKSNYQDRKPMSIVGKMKTLKIGGDVKRIINNNVWRYLTPVEYLRGQSMPDDYFDKATYKNKHISNSQRYKMCGNAFNKEVIKHIINQLNHAK